MKKVTAFVGSAHKKNTHKAVEQFLNNLKALGDVECEIVTLTDHNLGTCRGCRLCFMKGEQYCPLKDDRDILFEKIDASDGVIFATPNYCFQMSGSMKVFLDRFGYAIHRPRYFGKVFTSIVPQGFGGGGKIIENLGFNASLVGFNAIKGTTVTGFDPRTEEEQRKADRNLEKLSRKFYAKLIQPVNQAPTLYQMIIFRIGRSTIKQEADSGSIDFKYYTEKGWLNSPYYYPTRINPVTRFIGNMFDVIPGYLRKMMA